MKSDKIRVPHGPGVEVFREIIASVLKRMQEPTDHSVEFGKVERHDILSILFISSCKNEIIDKIGSRKKSAIVRICFVVRTKFKASERRTGGHAKLIAVMYFKSHLHQRTTSLKAQGIPLMSLQRDSVGFVPSSASSLNRQSFRSVSEKLLACCGSSILLSDLFVVVTVVIADGASPRTASD